jgi:hypothetical protein
MNHLTSLSFCGALSLASFCAPCANAQLPSEIYQSGNQRGSSTTRTQSITDCEPLTNRPGGNPGRSTGNTTDQSPLRHPTMTSPVGYLWSGSYSVHSQALSGVGDRTAGWAQVENRGPRSLLITIPSGRTIVQTTVTYKCTARSGMIYYEYGNQTVGFHKVDNSDPNFPTYDVWFMSPNQSSPNAVETWNYEHGLPQSGSSGKSPLESRRQR